MGNRSTKDPSKEGNGAKTCPKPLPPCLFIQQNSVSLPADVICHVLQFLDRRDCLSFYCLNSEWYQFISTVKQLDELNMDKILLAFLEYHYASWEDNNLLHKIFSLKAIVQANIDMSAKELNNALQNELQNAINVFVHLRYDVNQQIVLKCLTFEVDDYVANWRDNVHASNTLMSLLDQVTYSQHEWVKIVFRERRQKHTLQQSVLNPVVPLNMFEGMTNFGYNFEMNMGKLYETPMELFPTLIVGPYLIEVDESGLCIPKLCDPDMFEAIPRKHAKWCNLPTLVKFITQWNRAQWKARCQGVEPVVKRSFLEDLMPIIGLELDPIYSLLVRQYTPDMHGLKRNPFFDTRPMIFPVRHNLLDDDDFAVALSRSGFSLDSTNSIKMVLEDDEKVTCIKFVNHNQFDLFMFHLTEKAPILNASQKAESHLIANYDFCYHLRHRKAGKAVILFNKLGCIPHKHCRHKTLFL